MAGGVFKIVTLGGGDFIYLLDLLGASQHGFVFCPCNQLTRS
jgi:hypothetical protein